MDNKYAGPAVLRPDLIHEETNRRCVELTDSLKAVLAAIDALLEDKPLLAANLCGSTTLGNVRAELWSVLHGGATAAELTDLQGIDIHEMQCDQERNLWKNKKESKMSTESSGYQPCILRHENDGSKTEMTLVERKTLDEICQLRLRVASLEHALSRRTKEVLERGDEALVAEYEIEKARIFLTIESFCQKCEYRPEPGSCADCPLSSITGGPEKDSTRLTDGLVNGGSRNDGEL